MVQGANVAEQVYVIGPPCGRTVKIGVTVDLVRRLREIQNMSPVELRVLWSTPGGRPLEQALHSHFAEIRSHGEWFTFRSDPVQAVKTAVASSSIVTQQRPAPSKKDPYKQPPPLALDQRVQQLTWAAFADSRFTAADAADRLGFTLPTMLAHLDELVSKSRARQRPPVRSDRSRQLFTVRRPA